MKTVHLAAIEITGTAVVQLEQPQKALISLNCRISISAQRTFFECMSHGLAAPMDPPIF